MYVGIYNLSCTYELHQTFFSLAFNGTSLEDYYAKFHRVCEELDLAEPVSTDISVMQKHRESMCVARFLFGMPSRFDSVRA